MIPPFFTSCSSSGCTSTRSPSGLTLTAAIGFLYSFGFCFVVKPAIVSPCDYQSPADLPLLLFVFVDDLELSIDDVAFAFDVAFFSAASRLRFSAGLRTRARPGLRRSLLVQVGTDFLYRVL